MDAVDATVTVPSHPTRFYGYSVDYSGTIATFYGGGTVRRGQNNIGFLDLIGFDIAEACSIMGQPPWPPPGTTYFRCTAASGSLLDDSAQWAGEFVVPATNPLYNARFIGAIDTVARGGGGTVKYKLFTQTVLNDPNATPWWYKSDRLIIHAGYCDVDDDGGGGGDPPTDDDTGSRLIADTYHDIVAVAHCNKPNGGKKQLMIGVHRGIQKKIGVAPSATDGWERYTLWDVDEGSSIGLVFLPNGHLVATFSQGAAAKYSVNQKFGAGPKSNWSSPAAITPAIDAMLASGRGQGQGWRMRIG